MNAPILQPMKILIIHPWIRLGGAEQICWKLASQLQEQGHEARIVSTYFDPAGLPKQVEELEYLLPPVWMAQLARRNRAFFLLVAPWILLILAWKNSRDVDVLNPHNFPAAWVAVIVGMLRRIPVVWTCNEPPERIDWKTGFTVGIGDFFGWWLASSWIDRLLMKKVAKAYVPSELTRKQVRLRYGIDPSIVRLGVDSEFYGYGGETSAAKRLNLEGKFVLLCVGKLHPQKNQFVCIDALKLVLPEIPNAVLVLAGDGPMANELLARAMKSGLSSRVVFLGNTDSKEVRDLYAACNINLFPPTNQSWGLTPFEALCAEKVSIVSTDCGAAEVLGERGIGFICDPIPEAFAEMILAVHTNPNLSLTMARTGRRFVESNLTWNQYANDALRLMEDARFSASEQASQKTQGLTAR